MQEPGSHLATRVRTSTNTVEAYLRRHYKTIGDHEDKVREVLFTAMNGSLKPGMVDLAM